MSLPTQPIEGASRPADVASPYDDGHAPEPGLERSPRITVTRGGPPAEVLELLGSAAAAFELLDLQGLTVTFEDAEHGHTRITLTDLDGLALRALTPAEAIALACDEGLD